MIEHLTGEQATALLRLNFFGHIGCNDGFNTYVYPINYVFDGNCIFCHSLPGAKTAIMRLNGKVCLQVDEIKGAEDWKSVMVLGQYEEVEAARDRFYAVKVFAQQGMHLKVSSEAAAAHSYLLPQQRPPQNRKLVIFRIRIEEITGRSENG